MMDKEKKLRATYNILQQICFNCGDMTDDRRNCSICEINAMQDKARSWLVKNGVVFKSKIKKEIIGKKQIY